MARTRKKILYVQTETTYSTDPDATGAAHTYVPAYEIGEIQDTLELLENDHFTGRAHGAVAPEPGADGWSLEITVPPKGLLSAAGDTTDASTVSDDYYDIFLDHFTSTGTTTVGSVLTTVTDGTDVTATVDVHARQELCAIYEADLPSATAERTQWAFVEHDFGTGRYTIGPTITTPTTAAIAYGTKQHTVSDSPGVGLTFVVVQDDVEYTLTGGRCTSSSISMDSPGQVWKHKMSFSGDTKTLTTKGATLPQPGTTAHPPLKGMLSPMWFGTTNLAVSSIEIDFGISSAVQGSTAAVNGRAGYESIALNPTVTVTPLFSNTYTNWKRAATTGAILIQMGSGALSGGVLNTMAIGFHEAVAVEANATDENGRVRQSIQFRVTDEVDDTSSIMSRFMSIARA